MAKLFTESYNSFGSILKFCGCFIFYMLDLKLLALVTLLFLGLRYVLVLQK